MVAIAICIQPRKPKPKGFQRRVILYKRSNKFFRRNCNGTPNLKSRIGLLSGNVMKSFIIIMLEELQSGYEKQISECGHHLMILLIGPECNSKFFCRIISSSALRLLRIKNRNEFQSAYWLMILQLGSVSKQWLTG